MSSNVDYTICPVCFGLNAAMWRQNGLQDYQVYCTVCGHEYERGRFASDGVRLLVHEENPHTRIASDMDDLEEIHHWMYGTELDDDGLLALTPEEIAQILTEGYGSIYDRDYWEEI